MKLKRNLRAAALGFALATLAALSPLGIETAHAKTLVYCSGGNPEGFDPALYGRTVTLDASAGPLYSRLLEFERGTTNLIPNLAESWSVSEHGLEYTFHLRRGVKFHSTPYFTPTRDFNADDVIFSFLRQWKKGHPWHEYNPETSWRGFNVNGLNFLLADIRRDDDYTVTFVLSQPYAPLIVSLALDFASIVSAEYAAQLEASNSKPNFNTQPIGTGPFQFVAYQPDTEIRYKANPNYWNGVQAIDDLVFSITHKISAGHEKLKSGECHVAGAAYPAELESLRQEPGIVVSEQVGLNVIYLAYNTQDPPFDNVNVRKALNMAINKQAIVSKMFEGSAVVAKNPIPPSVWSYNQNTPDDVYNPTAARALLGRAGVSKLKMKIWVPERIWSPTLSLYSPKARAIAKMIRADFAAVGVKVKIISYEEEDRTKGFDRDGAVLAGYLNGIGDPHSFLGGLTCDKAGDYNLANWCNEEFDSLVWGAISTSDKAERTRLYEQAQLVFKREAPWATIAHSVIFVPISDKVIGYKVDPIFGDQRFEGVDIAE